MRETVNARQAYHDFYALGPQRSIPKLFKTYQAQGLDNAPSKYIDTLKRWSYKFGWYNRVAAQNAEVAKAQFEAIKARAVEAGYAHWPTRVRDLVELAELLLDEIKTEDKRWLPDVKQIGSGEDIERIDIVRFNSPLIEQFRKTLDDISAELGERRRGIELTGKDGGPIETLDIQAVRDQRWEEFTTAVSVGVDTKEDLEPTLDVRD